MGTVKTALVAFFAVSDSVFESLCLEGAQTVRAGFFLSFCLKKFPSFLCNLRPNFRLYICCSHNNPASIKERKKHETTDPLQKNKNSSEHIPQSWRDLRVS